MWGLPELELGVRELCLFVVCVCLNMWRGEGVPVGVGTPPTAAPG